MDDVVIEPDGAEEAGTSEEELEATESRVDSKLLKVKKELERTTKEKQEYLDGWQRAKADYVNALKRFEEEKRGAVALGSTKTLLLFMPALDSLARARAQGEQLPAGFEAIARQLEDASKQIGLSPIGAIGERFDPTMHEALGQDEARSVSEDDTITAVLETGWKSGDAVIRPAKVRVAHFEGQGQKT
ncbi:MAG: nucleotide exchange factor GrpE [Patescibacteria group bacterium]